MEYILIILVFLGIWFAIPTIYKIFRDEKAKKENAKKEKPKKEKSKKIKLDKDVEGFESIEVFNRDNYIQETFEQIFHAIKVDQWNCKFSWNEMEFKKDSVLLNVEYSSYSNFKIKKITLMNGYNRYYYKADLDVEVYRFFYDIYVKFIKEENATMKKKTDDSLVEINKVLGRDTIRDSKIDWLLNGEE
jgi:hypothetical protein